MGLLSRLLRRRRVTETLARDTTIDKAFSEMTMFMDASLLLVDAPSLSQQTPRLGTRLYFVGAAECLSRHYGLDDENFLSLALRTLTRLGTSDADAFATLGAIQQSSHEPFVRHAMIDGNRTLEQWLAGRDSNAAMRLSQAIKEWQDL